MNGGQATVAQWRFALLTISFAGLLGCSEGPELGEVEGRVTFQGQPVTQGMVIFQPKNGPAAIGEIDKEGHFTLTTLSPGDGALVGDHQVAIQATTVGAGQIAEPESMEEELNAARAGGSPGKYLVPGKVQWLVPEKYSRAESSGLTATVNPGQNVVDFELPDGPNR
jgi:hypothetical protein